MSAPDATEVFVGHRNLLFTVAYEMLGSVADAEDVLQETWLRWVEVDRGQVRDDRAYLVRITTRLALNPMRSNARRREAYVGPWLPEPLLTAPDVAEDAELADSLSLAMLTVLETLAPTERAVFVLREVFGFDYDEIAGAVGKSVTNVRQMAHRAREHVQARRKRFVPADSAMTAELTERFLSAASTGDVDGLMAMLAPDATWTADSGGKASAARRPVVGADKVAKVLAGLFRVAAERMPDVRFETAVYNGAPAMVVYNGEQLEGVFLLEITDGLISHFYAMRNPDKLMGIAIPRVISR
jgi:RNA polymerase sigma-70 factor (ECF subfamily)